MEVLHNSYVKGGLALGALLGPGRGWLLFLQLLQNSLITILLSSNAL